MSETLGSEATHTCSDVASPAWHEDELRLTERAVTEGRAHFYDWGEAKQRLLCAAKEAEFQLDR
ncbi:hypothetical protein BH20VER2_BH20VER2_04130 [soil metagenome]